MFIAKASPPGLSSRGAKQKPVCVPLLWSHEDVGEPVSINISFLRDDWIHETLLKKTLLGESHSDTELRAWVAWPRRAIKPSTYIILSRDPRGGKTEVQLSALPSLLSSGVIDGAKL